MASIASRILRALRGESDRADQPLARGRIAAIILAVLILASLPVVSSYIFLVVTSFANTIVFTPFIEFAVNWTVDNYVKFFQGKLSPAAGQVYSTTDIVMFIVNTLIVALGVTLVVLITSVPAGYAISRIGFRGRGALMKLLILLHAFPGVALIIAVYFIYIYMRSPLFQAFEYMASKGLLTDEVLASFDIAYSFFFVIVARASLEIPMSIWLMKGFFDKVPWEFEWAAIVDGASRFTAFRKAVLPLVKPGIAALAIFAFLAGWEDLIYVFVFLPQMTLATFIHNQLSGGSLETTYLPIVAAAATLYLLPTILFFVITQRLLLEAASGGFKG
ncbi:MAG: carbohydrate ABC transporter permease [Desulfurococcales archaeon]|nr:carbohydrate ABC transporter permease [Desulfurococcales archaeon]